MKCFLGDMLHCIISPIVSVLIFIYLYIFFLYFCMKFRNDYLKNGIPNYLQIFSESLALSGIVQASFSVWSLNHDVI